MIKTLRPDNEQYIHEQVKAGHFPTPEAVVDAAIDDMRDSQHFDLDDDTVAAINNGEEQGDQGEGIDFDEFRTMWEKRMSGT
jgi:hypothetical protein